ncbi:SDR family NAD(P)-dependent oxidoreductase [Paenibacillus bovis]|uniref:Oxidoreductase n=1 Tax=Paenibacillus bovis TaxID=1616788 RepID=A0A172ZKS7_9BACL|nr:SDR family oxidoreductase [Paenibacillus bovis]ANF98149.1 oxidoreductase [Paenibacillus bovis]
MNLENKVILITGASSGLGAGVAPLLLEQGAIPILTARSEDKLVQLSRGLNGPHEIIRMDVQSAEEIEQAVRQVMDKYGRIDILLNNAGYGQFKSIQEMELEEYSEMMDVNYMGIVRCTRAVLPYMLAAGSGQIVNVASLAGKFATAKSTAYTATKHAVLGFTNSLRQELRGTGITVSSINPGPISTAFFERADPSGEYVRNVSGFMLPPGRVCREIVRVMRKKKEESDLPGIAAFGLRLYTLCPRLVDRLTYRFFDRK